jgi:hypothetical protein
MENGDYTIAPLVIDGLSETVSLTLAADSEGEMAAENEQVEELVEEFRKSSIADLNPCFPAVHLTESLAIPAKRFR